MRHKQKRTVWSLMVVLMCLYTALNVWAAQIVDALYTGEDEENGYHYEWPGIGGFSTNILNGETSELVIVTPEKGMKTETYLNGELYENEGVFYENGEYEYRGYSKNREIEGHFYFTIENTYFEDSESDAADLYEVVTNPNLSVSYDKETGFYSYELPNHNTFRMSVPLGAMTSGIVMLQFGEGEAVYGLKKDGENEIPPDTFIFTEPGSYEMMMMSTKGVSVSTISTTYQVMIRFSIVEKAINDMDMLNAPLDFRIVQIKRDGKELEIKNGTSFYLEKDGYYQVRYEDTSNAKISYYQEFQIDRIPPYLTFSQSIYEGAVKAPLTFQPSEKECDMKVYQNGVLSASTEWNIPDGGDYHFEITDKAGNTRSYDVRVLYKSSFFNKNLIIAFVLLILLGIGWGAYQRRHIQIL